MAKSKTIAVRITEQTYKDLIVLSEDYGTVSDYVRFLILKEINDKK